MTTRRPLTVSLTPELSDMIANEVASGLYGSASEVVRAALRLLAESQQSASHGPARLSRKQSAAPSRSVV